MSRHAIDTNPHAAQIPAIAAWSDYEHQGGKTTSFHRGRALPLYAPGIHRGPTLRGDRRSAHPVRCEPQSPSVCGGLQPLPCRLLDNPSQEGYRQARHLRRYAAFEDPTTPAPDHSHRFRRPVRSHAAPGSTNMNRRFCSDWRHRGLVGDSSMYSCCADANRV